jgi:aerobic-type carbon monoxide dehydrogenase small subunit (CoxS/CutS family)
MIRFSVNGDRLETDLAAATPLLWFLRDNLQMTGTKYGCGIALCGACTVQIGGSAVGKKVQAAWIAEDVVQCGYCQSGQIMSATALLSKNKNPTDAQIDAAMSGNICRCGTYNRVRAAIKVAAGAGAATPAPKAKA